MSIPCPLKQAVHAGETNPAGAVELRLSAASSINENTPGPTGPGVGHLPQPGLFTTAVSTVLEESRFQDSAVGEFIGNEVDR